MHDNKEIQDYNTSPINNDSDNDGVRDDIEVSLGLDPNKLDSDDDGLNDGEDEDQ